jgi:hypothetical protein
MRRRRTIRSGSTIGRAQALANSAALKAAGVTRATTDVAGGEIVRSTGGEPTGLLKDNAMTLVEKVVPPRPDAMRDRALAAAMRYVEQDVRPPWAWNDLATVARARRANTLVHMIHAVPLVTGSGPDVVTRRSTAGPTAGR